MLDNFMELGLIHHSSDIESTVIFVPNKPHIVNNRYQRMESECE